MAVDAKNVKELREMCGAGMMDCKRALEDAGGNMEEAIKLLRKKGMSTADKKAARVANEGVVHAYIHPGARVGVLVEVNCETDFVARNEAFVAFAHDVAMQVAAASPRWVKREDIPQEEIDKELEIYTAQARETASTSLMRWISTPGTDRRICSSRSGISAPRRNRTTRNPRNR